MSKAFYRVAEELCGAAQLCVFILGTSTLASVYLSVRLGSSLQLYLTHGNCRAQCRLLPGNTNLREGNGQGTGDHVQLDVTHQYPLSSCEGNGKSS